MRREPPIKPWITFTRPSAIAPIGMGFSAGFIWPICVPLCMSSLSGPESLCDGPEAEYRAQSLDLDLDGSPEGVLSGPGLDLVAHPAYGGSVSVLDLRPQAFNVACALTRRPEAYHVHFADDHQEGEGGDEPQSIHDMVVFKEEGLEDYLIYDWYNRRLFQIM